MNSRCAILSTPQMGLKRRNKNKQRQKRQKGNNNNNNERSSRNNYKITLFCFIYYHSSSTAWVWVFVYVCDNVTRTTRRQQIAHSFQLEYAITIIIITSIVCGIVSNGTRFKSKHRTLRAWERKREAENNRNASSDLFKWATVSWHLLVAQHRIYWCRCRRRHRCRRSCLIVA